MLYYRKLLVISDNLYLVKAFHHILMVKGLDHQVSTKYMHSPASDRGLLQDLTQSCDPEIDVVNLKDPEVIKEIVANYDLVFSVHCKQLFPEALFTKLKCINIHPGYNPVNRGWFPQVFSIIHHHELGATIHEIDKDLDNGPVIDREKVPVYEWDTSLTAYNRVMEKEIQLLDRNLISILENEYRTIIPDPVSEESHLYLKKDFNKLLAIDLNEQGRFGDFIDRLRALSHGNYKNAFFITSDNKKVYLSIDLEVTEA